QEVGGVVAENPSQRPIGDDAVGDVGGRKRGKLQPRQRAGGIATGIGDEQLILTSVARSQAGERKRYGRAGGQRMSVLIPLVGPWRIAEDTGVEGQRV